MIGRLQTAVEFTGAETSPWGELKLISGSANTALATRIAEILDVQLTDPRLRHFPDGEINVKIEDSMRGHDVFVIQPTSPPVNEHLMELFIILDALRRASAGRVTAVIPYYGYARKERKTQPREPISAKLVANFTEAVANDLGAPIAFGYKRRPDEQSVEVIAISGDVKGRDCVVVEDIITTGNTVSQLAVALRQQGANRVIIAATHPVLSGDAMQKLRKADVEEVIVTDTVPIPPEKMDARLKVLSVAPLLAEAIIRVHENRSVSELFR